jgi:hypothetical protein
MLKRGYHLLMFPYPVGVQLFNRPDYAKQILSSLSQQTNSIDVNNLYIYIDGFSGSLYQSRGEIDSTNLVEKIAKEYFPNAHILRFHDNLGIAELHHMLQQAVFSGNFSWAAFFEEDIVLEPNYLEEIVQLIDIVNDTESVSKVSCFQILPCVASLPRGYHGFYPGHGTKAFAERKSFFMSKQEIVDTFNSLAKEYVGIRNQFRNSKNSSVIALRGYVLPYFQHDSLIESFLHREGKLHVVTRPNLAFDIGVEGIHGDTVPKLYLNEEPLKDVRNVQIRKMIFQNEIGFIQIEAEEHLRNKFESLFESFHISKSRKRLMKRIFQLTFSKM